MRAPDNESDLEGKKGFFLLVSHSVFLLFCYLDGKVQPAAFTYYDKTSALSLERLSLSVVDDWEVHIR